MAVQQMFLFPPGVEVVFWDNSPLIRSNEPGYNKTVPSETITGPKFVVEAVEALTDLQILHPSRSYLTVQVLKKRTILSVQTLLSTSFMNISHKNIIRLFEFGQSGLLYKTGEQLDRVPFRAKVFRKMVIEQAVEVFATRGVKPDMGLVGKWWSLKQMGFSIDDQFMVEAAKLQLPFSLVLAVCGSGMFQVDELAGLGELPASYVEELLVVE